MDKMIDLEKFAGGALAEKFKKEFTIRRWWNKNNILKVIKCTNMQRLWDIDTATKVQN